MGLLQKIDEQEGWEPEPQAEAPQRNARACPVCGCDERPIRKAKGSAFAFFFLLLFGLLPGLIYGIFYQGYKYVCPECGYKYGDAS